MNLSILLFLSLNDQLILHPNLLINKDVYLFVMKYLYICHLF